MAVNWNKIKYRSTSSGDTLFQINLLYCKLIKSVEITSLTNVISWYINTTNKYDKFALGLLPKSPSSILKPNMQLKEKMSACILWATTLHSVVKFLYFLWYNSTVLNHKKGNLKGNMHAKYHWKISYHSLNIIKKQICILWAGTVFRSKFGMLPHKTCIAIRNVLVQKRFLLSK